MLLSIGLVLLTAVVPGAETASAPGAECLQPGQKLVLRVRQVIPCDGLSPGERLLNGRALLVPGDHFLAEVRDCPSPGPMLVGGTVTRVHPPRWFRGAGHVELKIVQLVEVREGTTHACELRVDLQDRSQRLQLCRWLANLYFGLEGATVGAAIGTQLAQGNIGFIGGGAGIGLLSGLGAAALQHGPEGSLEPGDTFEIVVGSCSYKPLPRTTPLTIYPPCLPARK